MSEEESLLAAFLSQPADAALQKKYVAWLEERAARGEYLKLLAVDHDEPTSLQPGGPTRKRLEELRQKLDASWAERVDRGRLSFQGLYQSEPSAEGRSYLRFFPDGTVAAITSHEQPSQVWRRINAAGNVDRVTYNVRGGQFTVCWESCGASGAG